MFLTLIIILSFSYNAKADTTYVFCANNSGTEWNWLYDEHGNKVEINGFWGTTPLSVSVNSHYLQYFEVDENSLIGYKLRCQSRGMHAHPADGSLSDWFLFKVIKPDSSSYTTQGTFTPVRELRIIRF